MVGSMNLTSAKKRLVQQLARLDKLQADIRADQKKNGAASRQRIEAIDARLNKLRPVVTAWIKANFEPDAPALRKVAEEYCTLTSERYDCILAEGLAEEKDEEEPGEQQAEE